ncbi:MAG: hypothetical protein KKC68_00795 [Candidatus Thermoplasmatota archaeon]|nr:hypothetical protein [Candidatus Thermoplasmatota archaeon]MBU1940289.1 hypothetical protein [Candidatus Thermoplasmatota archaeon]
MKKIAICPQCHTKKTIEGDPEQKIIIQCDTCGKKGIVVFRETPQSLPAKPKPKKIEEKTPKKNAPQKTVDLPKPKIKEKSQEQVSSTIQEKKPEPTKKDATPKKNDNTVTNKP